MGQSNGNEADAQFAAALRAALIRTAAVDALSSSTQGIPALPDRLLDLIVRTATRAVPSSAGTLFLVDVARRLLTFDVVVSPTAEAVKDLTVPLGHGIAGLVAVSGQPLAIANAQDDPRHARDVAERSGYFPDTILAVPITAGSSTVGVLELLDRQGAATFSLNDMELLGRFAELTALVLELRRAQMARTILIGQSLAALIDLPEATRLDLEGHLAELAERAAADPATTRTLVLAEQVAAIGRHGEAEQQACAGVLAVFAAYLDAHSAPGFDLDALR